MGLCISYINVIVSCNYVICGMQLRFVDDLKNYIRDAFQEINVQSDLCEKVCRSVRPTSKFCKSRRKAV